MNNLTHNLTIIATIGAALVAGIFFAFSTFVMNALERIQIDQGIAAMKMINITVINPWFFSAFFGTGVVCLVIALLAFTDATEVHKPMLLAACALYVFGCVIVTIVFNVPWNNRLASTEPNAADAEAVWTAYLSRWTFWNHVRTAASLAAAALFAMTL